MNVARSRPLPPGEALKSAVALGLKLYSQVQRVANIAAELDYVVAFRLGPIVHKLDLLLAFRQWAIAASGTKAVTEAGNYAAVTAIVVSTTLADDRITAQGKETQTCGFRIASVHESRPIIVGAYTESVHRCA